MKERRVLWRPPLSFSFEERARGAPPPPLGAALGGGSAPDRARRHDDAAENRSTHNTDDEIHTQTRGATPAPGWHTGETYTEERRGRQGPRADGHPSHTLAQNVRPVSTSGAASVQEYMAAAAQEVTILTHMEKEPLSIS